MNAIASLFSSWENLKLDPWLADGNPWYLIPAILGLGFFIGLFFWLFRLLKEGRRKEIVNPNDLLTQFRAMEEEGELTAAEFRNIKLMLADKLLERNESNRSKNGRL